MEKCTLQVHVCSIPNGRVKVSIVPKEWNFRLSGIMGWNYSTCSSGNKMLFSVPLVSNDQVINIFVLKKSSAECFWSCFCCNEIFCFTEIKCCISSFWLSCTHNVPRSSTGSLTFRAPSLMANSHNQQLHR